MVKSKLLWGPALLISLLYLSTSLVVIINSFVWMPSFPTAWYNMESAMYWPFQPYMDVMLKTLGKTDVSYQAYTMISRAPFVLISVLALVLSVRKILGRGSAKPLEDARNRPCMTPEGNSERSTV